ncbi:MAG: PKD domain-containing protein [Bacteroidota bacterium]
MTVSVNDELIVDAGPDDSICYEGMTVLAGQVNGGATPYTVNWSTTTGSTVGLTTPNQLSTVLAGWTTTDTLLLQVIDNAGCPAEDTVVVAVNPEIIVDPGVDTLFCYRDSLRLGGNPTGAGGTGALNYQWEPSTALIGGGPTAANPIVYQLDDTLTYMVFVTDALNCTDSASVFVQENPAIVVDAGPLDSICFEEVATLSGTVSGGSPFVLQTPYQYAWAPSNVIDPNNLTTLTAPLNASTQFILTVTDSAGCQNEDSVSIVVNPVIIANADTNRTVCYEETTVLNGTVSGGTPGYTYAWFPSIGLDDTTSLTPICSGLQQTTTYTLVATDAVGCTDTAQVTITVNPELMASAGGDDAICFAAPTSLSGSATGGTPSYNWAWTSLGAASVVPPNVPNPQIVGLTSTDTLILEVTDQIGCTDTDTLVIIVNPPMSIQAFGDSVCYEETGALVSVASGGTPFSGDSAYAFEWIPTTFIQNPNDSVAMAIAPTSTQIYQVFVTDSVGCQDSAEAVLTVNPQLVADAGADQVLCFGDTITIGGSPAAIGGTSGYEFQWNPVVGLNNALLPNPEVSDLMASQAYVILVTDSVGCTATDTTFIYANPELTVDAGPDDSICYNTDALLNGTVTGGTPPYAPTWTGGVTPTPTNALNATDPNLLATQTYFIDLVDSVGCIVSDSVIKSVNPELIATAVDDSLCDGDVLTMMATVTGGSPGYSYAWTPDTFLITADSLNPVISGLDSTITYQLVATDVLGCTDTAVSTITYLSLPNPDFFIAFNCFSAQNPVACVGEQITFIDASTIDSLGVPIVQWEWDFDNDGTIDATGDTVTHIYSSANTYTIKLVTTSIAGCKDSTTKTLTVVDIPVAGFDLLPDSGCAPLSYTLTNTSTGYIIEYDWVIYGVDILGNVDTVFTSTQQNLTNPPILPQGQLGDTTFYVSLTTTNCCGSNTFTDSILIQPLPLVDFEANTYEGCSPLPVRFILEELTTVQNIDSVVFHWGDGTPSTTVFPLPMSFPLMWDTVLHVFIGQQYFDTTYFVTLIGYNECGTDTITKSILVKPNSVRAFFNIDQTDGCEDLTFRAIDLAVGDSVVTSWCWNYDPILDTCLLPGPPSPAGDTLFHTFTDPGDYIVAQFANNGCGYDTTTILVQVRPQPDSDFGLDGICVGDSTHFLNLSTINDSANFQGASINGYMWSIDSGRITSLSPNPSVVFDSSGTYEVVLISTSDRDCQDTLVRTITIWDRPTAIVEVDSACLGTPTFIDDQSQYVVSPSRWDFRFGDNNDTTLRPPLSFPIDYTYGQPGTYGLTMIVTDANGCTDTAEHDAIVLDLPQPAFTTSEICSEDSTLFIDQSGTGANNIPLVRWEWNLGDGTLPLIRDTQDPFQYLYGAAGVYDVVLTVTDAFGCENTLRQPVIVDTLPIADFTVTQACWGEVTSFNDASQSTSQRIVSWAWDLGDGTTSTQQNVTHQYAGPGIYQVTLTVTDLEGCMNSITRTVTINLPPVANFFVNALGLCKGDSIPLVDLSEGVSGAITNWDWDFGNGVTRSGQNPNYAFALEGFYPVTLTVTNAVGCIDDTTVEVVVTAPVADFIQVDTPRCLPSLIEFEAQPVSGANIVQWEWDFGDSSQQSFIINPSHLFTGNGLSPVTLTVTDVAGCKDSVTIPISVIELPYPFGESIVRATVVDTTPLQYVVLEWEPLEHPDAEYLVIQKSSDNGITFEELIRQPIDSTVTSFIDGAVFVDLKPYQYRIAVVDSCTNVAPISNLGTTIHLQSRNAENGTELYWTPYLGWDSGVESYEIQRINENGIFEFVTNVPGDVQSYVDDFSLSSNLVNSTYYDIQYRVRAIELFGNDTSSMSNKVTRSSQLNLYMPTAFSPNGDDDNDEYFVEVHPEALAREFEMQIFNRWGQLVYKTDKVGEEGAWDSVDLKGRSCPQGVYVARATVTSINGQVIEKVTTVTLRR